MVPPGIIIVMSELSLTEIDHLATLARIRLTDEEKERLGRELGKIVDFYATIQAASSNGQVIPEQAGRVKPIGHLRPDELHSGPSGLTQDELKKLAPEVRDNLVVVPAVFE